MVSSSIGGLKASSWLQISQALVLPLVTGWLRCIETEAKRPEDVIFLNFVFKSFCTNPFASFWCILSLTVSIQLGHPVQCLKESPKISDLNFYTKMDTKITVWWWHKKLSIYHLKMSVLCKMRLFGRVLNTLSFLRECKATFAAAYFHQVDQAEELPKCTSFPF